MGELIKKDFVLQKRTSYVYLAIGTLFFFYFDAMDQRNMIAVMMPTVMIIYGFMNRSMAEDEKNHTLRMLVALPIPRAAIVRAKYASIALVAVMATAVFMALGAAAGIYSMEEPDSRAVTLLTLSAFTLVCTVLVSFFLPLVYKIGIVRAQSINRFFFAAVFAFGIAAGTLGSMIARKLQTDGEPPFWVEALRSMEPLFAGMSPYAWVILLFALSALIYFVSMRLSIRFLERRELF